MVSFSVFSFHNVARSVRPFLCLISFQLMAFVQLEDFGQLLIVAVGHGHEICEVPHARAAGRDHAARTAPVFYIRDSAICNLSVLIPQGSCYGSQLRLRPAATFHS